MIKYVEGDLFEHIKTINKRVIIPHVCNSLGKMGSGFVIPLQKHFPLAKELYIKWCNDIDMQSIGVRRFAIDNELHYQTGEFGLGKTQFIKVSNDENGNYTPQITVANMIAQSLGGERPLFYNKLVHCMEDVATHVMMTDAKLKDNTVIVAPLFGSSLAGGNWLFIEELIIDIWDEYEVNICYLPQHLPYNWSPPEVKS